MRTFYIGGDSKRIRLLEKENDAMKELYAGHSVFDSISHSQRASNICCSWFAIKKCSASTSEHEENDVSDTTVPAAHKERIGITKTASITAYDSIVAV